MSQFLYLFSLKNDVFLIYYLTNQGISIAVSFFWVIFKLSTRRHFSIQHFLQLSLLCPKITTKPERNITHTRITHTPRGSPWKNSCICKGARKIQRQRRKRKRKWKCVGDTDKRIMGSTGFSTGTRNWQHTHSIWCHLGVIIAPGAKRSKVVPRARERKSQKGSWTDNGKGKMARIYTLLVFQEFSNNSRSDLALSARW